MFVSEAHLWLLQGPRSEAPALEGAASAAGTQSACTGQQTPGLAASTSMAGEGVSFPPG